MQGLLIFSTQRIKLENIPHIAKRTLEESTLEPHSSRARFHLCTTRYPVFSSTSPVSIFSPAFASAPDSPVHASQASLPMPHNQPAGQGSIRWSPLAERQPGQQGQSRPSNKCRECCNSKPPNPGLTAAESRSTLHPTYDGPQG